MRPQWYVRLRPSVIRAFHQVLEMAPVNLQAIEDFQGDFEQDQVHFTCLSGIYYVQHLADRVLSMLEVPAPAKQVRYIVPSDLILLVCFIFSAFFRYFLSHNYQFYLNIILII